MSDASRAGRVAGHGDRVPGRGEPAAWLSEARMGPVDGATPCGACGCEEAIDRLFEYLDAELPEPDCLRLAAHLAVCDGCLDAASAERHVRELLRRSCTEAAPDTLRLRVVSQLTVWDVQQTPPAGWRRA